MVSFERYNQLGISSFIQDFFYTFVTFKKCESMERYTKPPLTYQQQVELLKSRGLQFADEARAKRHLANISYYRMSAYMLPFKEANQEGEILDSFKKGITWDHVYNLYVF